MHASRERDYKVSSCFVPRMNAKNDGGLWFGFCFLCGGWLVGGGVLGSVVGVRVFLEESQWWCVSGGTM